MVALFLLAAARLFVWPVSDRLRPAGAIVSLNGRDEQMRESYAESLLSRHLSSVLLFSLGSSGSVKCPVIKGVTVVCFVASPSRTVGEVDFAARYARQHGITSLIFVAGHAQATRGRLLAHRCFSGEAMVVPAPIPWWHLPYEIAYESGALVKALIVAPGCS